MASGKTFLARALHRTLGYTLCDTDQIIEAIAQQNISAIFKQHGETHFRDMESTVCQNLINYEQTIIATGGGIILRSENRPLLQKAGTVFFLKSSAEQTWLRVKNDQSRPLLQVEDRFALIEKLIKERTPLYQECADIVLDSDCFSIPELTKQVTTFLKLNC